MSKISKDDPRTTGENVWESLRNQLTEAGGFLHAMALSCRRFIRKQAVYFLGFGIITAALAVGLSIVLPDVYSADMTVSYTHYEKKIYADMLQKLNRLAEEKSFGDLARLLGMEEEAVSEICSIEAFNIKSEELVSDLSTEKVPFYITVMVKDNAILPALQQALVDYLDGTEFIQERLKYRAEKNKEELGFLDRQLAVTDSLLRLPGMEAGEKEGAQPTMRMQLMEEHQDIYSRIQQVRENLAFNNNIEVLDGFVAGEKPVGPVLMLWMLYGFLAGVALRLLVLIFR